MPKAAPGKETPVKNRHGDVKQDEALRHEEQGEPTGQDQNSCEVTQTGRGYKANWHHG
jgi:hypothetical protein